MELNAGRADVRANRARLIEAAQAVLGERGTDAEVKEIAERAGLGIGTFYRHFPTKEDLIVAIAGDLLDLVNTVLDEAVAMDDPISAIQHLVRAGSEVTERYGDLMEVLQGSVPRSLKAHLDRADPFTRVAAILQAGIERGAFRSDLNTEVAVATLGGVWNPHMYQQLRRTLSRDEIAEQSLQLFLRGAGRSTH